jgi:hypothetical protein
MRKKEYTVVIPNIEQMIFGLPPYFKVKAISTQEAERMVSIIVNMKKNQATGTI